MKIKRNKLVYVCSPLRGDIEYNIKMANLYSKFVFIQGYIPYAPHTIFTQFLDDTDSYQREAAIEMGNTMLLKCDELWTFGNKISDGMQTEIDLADLRNIPVKNITLHFEKIII
jgi:hypothetical protein